jgi:hypothetical protein
MPKTIHFHFYDAGAYDGETEHRIMVNFYSITDGVMRPGQSSLVLASEWPTFRSYLERGGWTHREYVYGGIGPICGSRFGW